MKNVESMLAVFGLIFFLSSSTVFSSDDNEVCTYVIYIKTGNLQNAGTNAKVSLQLKDTYLNHINITNLESHGVLGKWHDYFQVGNLDAFAVKSKCLDGPVCSMAISHDNSGFAPGWYVESVDVTAISPFLVGCRKSYFPVADWLDVKKVPFSTRKGVYLCDEIVHLGFGCDGEN